MVNTEIKPVRGLRMQWWKRGEKKQEWKSLEASAAAGEKTVIKRDRRCSAGQNYTSDGRQWRCWHDVTLVMTPWADGPQPTTVRFLVNWFQHRMPITTNTEYFRLHKYKFYSKTITGWEKFPISISNTETQSDTKTKSISPKSAQCLFVFFKKVGQLSRPLENEMLKQYLGQGIRKLS